MDYVVELLDKRTLTQKTFDLGNGSKRLNAHIGHIHYQSGALKNGSMSEIDTTLNYNAQSAKYSMTNASYEAEIGLYGDVHFHNVDSAIEFTLANPNRIQAEAYTGSEFGKIGKALIWKDIIDKGAHQIVECRNGSLVKIFHFDIAPKNLTIDFACNMTSMDFDALTTAKPTADKAFSLSPLSTARSLELKSASKTTYIRKATAWNHRGERIGIELSFYLDTGGKLRAVKTLPQEFVDKTFTELGAWLECDTTTSYYAGAGDGSTWYTGTAGKTWSTVRGASIGTYTPFPATTAYILTGYTSPDYAIRRLFLPVDTSGLPDASIISSACFNLYSTGGATTTRGVTFVQTTQEDCTTLVNADYGRITLNSPTEGSTRLLFSDFPSNSYRSIDLNTSGIGWIVKTGYTKLCLRETLQDIDDNAPTDQTYLYTRTSGYTGTDYDPYLEVDYKENQQLHPISDVTVGNWLNQDGGTVLYSALDEVTPDTSDYVYHSIGDGTFECGLTVASTPKSGSQYLYVGHRASGTSQVNIVYGIYDNSVLVQEATFTNVGTIWTVGTFTMGSAISSYANLSIRPKSYIP